MSSTLRIVILTYLLALNYCYSQQSQHSNRTVSNQDSVSSLIMSADEVFYSLTSDGQEVDTLINNVTLVQDSVFMACDYAIVRNQIQAFATGNIIIIHKDSTVIYADTLRYNGILKRAVLTGEVILDSRGKRLNTDRLLYDLNTENASFNTGAKLIDDTSTLDALYGKYDVPSEEAVFKYNVKYQDTSMVVIADSILYDYYHNQIRFLGPTNIYRDSTTIYTESGVYDTREEKGVLSQNVQIETDDKIIKAGLLIYDGQSSEYNMYIDPSITESDGSIATGDSIYYNANDELLRLMRNANYISEEQSVEADEIVYDLKNDLYTTVGKSQVIDQGSMIIADTILKTDEGQTIAMGLVTLRDTSSGTTIYCDLIESTEFGHRACSLNGQPMLIYELGSNDSLFLRADTLLTEKTDSIDLFVANQNVSLLKGEISGRSNSMVYDKLDSLITLSQAPIMWSDSTQLTADTILITMDSGDIDGLDLVSEAYIVEMDSEEGFNQVNGDRIDCEIVDQQLQNAQVISSAQMIYFIRDENDFLKGVNKTLSSSMLFSFSNNQIDNVYFYKNPESEITEYQEGMDLNVFRLDGVEWRLNEKPDFSIFAHPNMKLVR